MDTYLVLKSLHIISFVAWMAGLFYLPRLFAYHCRAKVGSEMDKAFATMEYKLLRIIMNPAMISTLVFGLGLIYQLGFYNIGKWLHVKIILVLMLAGFQGFLGKCRKKFAMGTNQYTERFYRLINELPTVLLVIIVSLAVFKPF